MAKITKAQVDKNLRERVFDSLFGTITLGEPDGWNKINDRQMGIIMYDLNGEKRYVRIGVIVATPREDMTAEELMQTEIDEYERKQDEKEVKRLKKEQKIANDKAKREKESEENA